MKKFSLIFSLALGLAVSGWSAVTPPANLAVGNYNTDKTTMIYWDEDTTITQWNIYFGGLIRYSASRSDTGVTPTARRSYLMTGIASTTLPVVITMRAIKAGSPISAESVAVTLTAVTPVNNFTYVYPAPNAVFPTTASGSGGTVIQGASNGGGDPWWVQGNNIDISTSFHSAWDVNPSIFSVSSLPTSSMLFGVDRFTNPVGPKGLLASMIPWSTAGPYNNLTSLSVGVTDSRNGHMAAVDSSDRLSVMINNVGGSAIGQKAMASSFPVVIASDQAAFPVNINFTGGQQAMASSFPVVIASDQNLTVQPGNTANTTAWLVSDSNTANVLEGATSTAAPFFVKQGSAFTVSGSVSTAGNVSLNAGTSAIGSVTLGVAATGLAVNISNTPAVTCALCATSANQTSQTTAQQSMQGALTQSAGLAINLSQAAGTNIAVGLMNTNDNLSSATTYGIWTKGAIYGFDYVAADRVRPVSIMNNPQQTAKAQSNAVLLTTASISYGVNGTNYIANSSRIDGGGNTTAVVTAITEGFKTTYYASVTGLAISNLTDFFTITGSSTKTIRVLRVQVSGIATAASAVNLVALIRSTADSSGTAITAGNIPADSASAAATAVVKGYTASPTLGTLTGFIRGFYETFTTAAGAIPNVPIILDFGTRPGQACVLRGTAQQFCLNEGSAAVAGLTVNVDAEWTEE